MERNIQEISLKRSIDEIDADGEIILQGKDDSSIIKKTNKLELLLHLLDFQILNSWNSCFLMRNLILDHIIYNCNKLAIQFNNQYSEIFKLTNKKITIQKILKTNAFTNEDRVKKINGFLNKVRLEQNKKLAKRNNQTEMVIKKVSGNLISKSGQNKKLKKDYEHK